MFKKLKDNIKEEAAANCLENVVKEVLAEGKYVTYDLKPKANDPTAAGTQEMADAIIRKIQGHPNENIYNWRR